MSGLTVYENTALSQRQTITADLITDFISYIDRTKQTTRTYLTNLRQFMAWMRYTGTTAPTRQDVIAYKHYLSTPHLAIMYAPGTAAGWIARDNASEPITCKPATVKIYLQSVKQFFKWTERAGLYPNVADNIHAPKVTKGHRKDALNPSDVVAIEHSIKATTEAKEAAAAGSRKDSTGKAKRATEQGARLNAMYQLAVNAGLRVIELSRANIRDLETKGGKTWLYIWGKGHTEADQKKPLAKEVAKAVYDYLDMRTDAKTGASPLFVSTGNRSHGQRIASTTISTMLKKAMQEAGYNSDRLTAHSLRHTAAASVMRVTQNNIYQAQRYLRHESPATTEIYLDNKDDDDNAALADKVYTEYHSGADQTDNSGDLIRIAATLTASQLASLAQIAKAMQA